MRLDVEHPLKGLSLNYGLKCSLSQTDNHFRYYDTSSGMPIEDPKRSNTFTFEEHIQALYFSARKSLGKKWQTKLGLRGENTQTRGNSITLGRIDTHAYFQLFPTAYLLYCPNPKHRYSLSYSRRISRPSFNALNPFKFYTSPYSYSSGNPDLKPVYTTDIELDYSYDDLLYGSIWYAHDKDNASQVTRFESDYRRAVLRLNYFQDYTIGIHQGIRYTKVPWWQLMMGLDLFYTHSSSTIYPITPRSIKGFGGTLVSYDNFFLNKAKTCSVGFLFKYRSPSNSGDMRYNYARYRLNAFFKLLLLNRDLQLSIRGNNLTKAYSYDNKSLRNGFSYFSKGYLGDRYFNLAVSYRFGNKKIRVNEHQVHNRDERRRLN